MPEPSFHRGDRCRICGDLFSDERPSLPERREHIDCVDWRFEAFPASHERALERARVRHRALREMTRITGEFGAWLIALRRGWPRGGRESAREIAQWEALLTQRLERLAQELEAVDCAEFVGPVSAKHVAANVRPSERKNRR